MWEKYGSMEGDMLLNAWNINSHANAYDKDSMEAFAVQEDTLQAAAL